MMERARIPPRNGYLLVAGACFREQAREAVGAFFAPVTALYGAMTRASDPTGSESRSIDRAQTSVTGADLVDEAIHG